MRTKIISAFPGCGKTFFCKKNKEKALDADSSMFSWKIVGSGERVRNEKFPENYIKHIKDNIGVCEFIFVSSHKEIRDVLLDSCIFFYLVHPSITRREEFLERYRQRGDDEKFVQMISENWNDWIREMRNSTGGLKVVDMVSGNLEDELNLLFY